MGYILMSGFCLLWVVTLAMLVVSAVRGEVGGI